MKLEAQVCNLDLAKRLRDLGVKQESEFVWFNNSAMHSDFFWSLGFRDELNDHDVRLEEDFNFSAFTVAELGEMLPKKIEQVRKHGTSRTGFWLNISFDESSRKWRYSYANHKANECIEMIFDETEADARAKMLIYLIENKLINPHLCPKN